MNSAVIFPGQGAQYPGMGRSFYENFSESRDVFGAIDTALGFKLSEKCFNGSQEELKSTRLQQLAIVAVSLAGFEIFKRKGLENVTYFSGLSLGEYSCLYAAGVLKLEDVILLVKERSEAMEEAAHKNASCMYAVLGMDRSALGECQSLGFYIANVNSPQQVVISLDMTKKEEVKKGLEQKGAKVIELQVSGGFHSPFMESAKVRLQKVVDALEFSRARTPLESNVTACAHVEPEEIKRNLIQQMVSPVLWKECVEFMIGRDVGRFFEIGPSRVLKGLVRKINRKVAVRNFEKQEDFVGQ